jgi:hypothetical protein
MGDWTFPRATQLQGNGNLIAQKQLMERGAVVAVVAAFVSILCQDAHLESSGLEGEMFGKLIVPEGSEQRVVRIP